MIYIGIDNGVSGSIGIIEEDGSYTLWKTPVLGTLSYTKKAQHIHRIDIIELRKILSKLEFIGKEVQVFLERPMVNPMQFMATVSAVRALEATLIVIDELKYSLRYIDSKEWQKVLLPSGLKGSPVLKAASLEIGKRLFPKIDYAGLKMKDADGILIAEYARRTVK